MRQSGAAPLQARRTSEPRVPRHERGVQRYGELLDALERLLETNHPDDVGIYQIAKNAKAPPASTYHFFPTKEAAFVALAERYFNRFQAAMHVAVPASAFTSWLSLVAHDSRASAAYFNRHPAALTLVIGRYGGLRVREMDIQHNRNVARQYVRRIQSAFDLPDIVDAPRKFHTMLEIQDAIWAISYVNHRMITPEYELEAIRAAIAYVRLYYPEEVTLKDEIRALIDERHDKILPKGWLDLDSDQPTLG